MILSGSFGEKGIEKAAQSASKNAVKLASATVGLSFVAQKLYSSSQNLKESTELFLKAFTVANLVGSADQAFDRIIEIRKELLKDFALIDKQRWKYIGILRDQERSTLTFGSTIRENYQSFIELSKQMGTFKFAESGDMANLIGTTSLISKAFDISEESSANMVGSLSLFQGMKFKNIESLYKNIAGASDAIGVSHKSVAENIAQSSDSLYRFAIDSKSSAKNFGEMAAFSQRIGLNIDDIVSATKQTRHLAGAIETAALAGQMGINLSPTRLMMESRIGGDPTYMFKEIFSQMQKYGFDSSGKITDIGIDIAEALSSTLGMSEEQFLKSAMILYKENIDFSKMSEKDLKKLARSQMGFFERLDVLTTRFTAQIIDPLAKIILPGFEFILDKLEDITELFNKAIDKFIPQGWQNKIMEGFSLLFYGVLLKSTWNIWSLPIKMVAGALRGALMGVIKGVSGGLWGVGVGATKGAASGATKPVRDLGSRFVGWLKGEKPEPKPGIRERLFGKKAVEGKPGLFGRMFGKKSTEQAVSGKSQALGIDGYGTTRKRDIFGEAKRKTRKGYESTREGFRKRFGGSKAPKAPSANIVPDATTTGAENISRASRTLPKARVLAAQALQMIAFAGAIWILSKAFQNFSKDVDFKGVMYGVGVMGVFTIALMGISKAITASAGPISATSLLLGVFAGAIWLISKAFQNFADASKGFSKSFSDFILKTQDVDYKKIASGIVSIGLALGSFGAIFNPLTLAFNAGGFIAALSMLKSIGKIAEKYASPIGLLSTSLSLLATSVDSLNRMSISENVGSMYEGKSIGGVLSVNSINANVINVKSIEIVDAYGERMSYNGENKTQKIKNNIRLEMNGKKIMDAVFDSTGEYYV